MNVIAANSLRILPLLVTNILQVDNVWRHKHKIIHIRKHAVVLFSQTYYSHVYFRSTYYGRKL